MKRRGFFGLIFGAALAPIVKPSRPPAAPAPAPIPAWYQYVRADRDLPRGAIVYADNYPIGVTCGTILKNHYGWVRVSLDRM